MEQQELMNDKECEELVISHLINMPTGYDEVRDILTPLCFHNHKYKEIFECILSISGRGDPISFITINAELQKRQSITTMSELVDLMEYGASINLYTYALRLRELACRRKFWEIGQMLIAAGTTEAEEVTDIQLKARNELDNLFEIQVSSYSTLADTYEEVRAIMQRNRTGYGINGTPTGYSELDKRGGLRPSDLVIIAGESSQGKTAYATSLALNAIQNNENVAFYSMEMTGTQLTARICAMLSGISSSTILQQAMCDEQIIKVEDSMQQICKERLLFDDSSTSNIDTILSSIRSMKLKYNISGAIVDYLQILNVNMKNSNKEQQMGDVCRRLKNIAKDLGIWVIALSQLSRDKDNPVPSISRLRDSGQIAEAADIVALVYRPKIYGKNYPEPFEQATTEGTAMIDVAKGRNIGIFKFLCGFRESTTEFYELQQIPPNERNNNLPF